MGSDKTQKAASSDSQRPALFLPKEMRRLKSEDTEVSLPYEDFKNQTLLSKQTIGPEIPIDIGIYF